MNVSTPKSQVNGQQQFVRKRVSSLKPSPENERIYRPTYEDEGIDDLGEKIERNGCDPFVTTKDGFIVSGHRRFAALQRIGQKWVYCQVLKKNRDEYTDDEYVALLASHNSPQRQKTVAEQVREELIDVDPDNAYQRLCEARSQAITRPSRNGVHALEIKREKVRHGISEDKAEHVKFIKQIVFVERRDFWPLSVRSVHYPLLNYDFIRGYYWPRRGEPDFGIKRELRYKNDQGSYDATSDLITRLRLNRDIPWEAFDDPTRPMKAFLAFDDVRQYIRQEVNSLFTGYWRKKMRTQPAHIAVVCEKNTIFHMAVRVTEKYHIPTFSARGFASIDLMHDLYEEYISSGKDQLIVIVLSDYDPEGQQIPLVIGRTLRDDFYVPDDELSIIKAGVTREQITKYNLPKQNFAKESSSNHDWFVANNNGDDSVYELEALTPQDMMGGLDHVIRNVIDIDLFNREVALEREESAYIEAARKTAVAALKGIAD